MIVVTGFGPFLDVTDNPSARLARAVDGRSAGDLPVVGHVLPVSFGRAIPELHRFVANLPTRPRLLLGTGVARSTACGRLERTAAPSSRGLDVDGRGGALRVPAVPRYARADLPRLASALDVAISDDAGRYVCNAWLYDATAAFPHTAVAFLHVPDTGFDAERLLRGLARYFATGAGGAGGVGGVTGAIGPP